MLVLLEELTEASRATPPCRPPAQMIRTYWRTFEHIPWDKLRIALASEFREPTQGWWIIKWNTDLRDFIAYMLPETRADLLAIIRMRKEERVSLPS